LILNEQSSCEAMAKIVILFPSHQPFAIYFHILTQKQLNNLIIKEKK